MTDQATAVSAPSAPKVSVVYHAISAVQAELAHEGIGKERENTQQKFRFRGVDDLYNAMTPLLAKYNLLILPRVTSLVQTERKTKEGYALHHALLKIEVTFLSLVDDSRYVVPDWPGEAMDSGDKVIGKAISYALKSLCFATFQIPTEGDSDPDQTTHPPTMAAKPPADKKSSGKPAGGKASKTVQQRLADAKAAVDAALDAGDREKVKGLVAFAVNHKDGLGEHAVHLQAHAAWAIARRLPESMNALECGRELHQMQLIRDVDWKIITDRIDALEKQEIAGA